jgi:putative IMPACT (imprinted ancient) family translation regulator
MPIYGQYFPFLSQTYGVARVFGGVKLGVGGLISAYKTTAQHTLESCEIIEKRLISNIKFHLIIKNMNKVMRIIKEKS